MFLMVGETGAPTENPRKHRENIQTPHTPHTLHTQAPRHSQESNPGHSCYEATVLTTKPPCCPTVGQKELQQSIFLAAVSSLVISCSFDNRQAFFFWVILQLYTAML